MMRRVIHFNPNTLMASLLIAGYERIFFEKRSAKHIDGKPVEDGSAKHIDGKLADCALGAYFF